jgi:hypothetical protein
METSSRNTNVDTHADSDSEYEYIDESTPGPGHYNGSTMTSAIRP